MKLTFIPCQLHEKSDDEFCSSFLNDLAFMLLAFSCSIQLSKIRFWALIFAFFDGKLVFEVLETLVLCTLSVRVYEISRNTYRILDYRSGLIP